MAQEPKTIVAIDDDESTLELVKVTLTRGGYLYKGTLNSRDAVALIEAERPSAVLLDLMMPQLNGWEVYEAIRTNEKIKHIPVIIMTAMSSGMDRVLGLRIARVADYINKPFSPSELINSIGKVIADQEAS